MSGSSSSPSPSQARPEPAWTRRQSEVLDLLVRGDTNPEIAQALGISLDGAKWHVSEVITKLGVDSRDEAAEYWRAHNGLRPRFTRIFHALVASTWLKVGGGVAVVAGASVAVAVIMIALNGSGTSPKPATPTATTAGWTVTTAAGGSQLRGDVPAAVAGFKDGPAAAAEFDRPVGMAAAPDGSVYIADSGNHRVRRLTVAGQVETVAGSGAAGATDGPAFTRHFEPQWAFP
jgi:DNA-binding CsgD family transcriptional regulator